MFASLIDDELSELSYDAELAGLRYSVSNSQSGFLVGGRERERFALPPLRTRERAV